MTGAEVYIVLSGTLRVTRSASNHKHSLWAGQTINASAFAREPLKGGVLEVFEEIFPRAPGAAPYTWPHTVTATCETELAVLSAEGVSIACMVASNLKRSAWN